MDRFDVLAFVGLVLVGVGLWLVSPSVALTVVGALLVIFGVVGAWRHSGIRAGGEG